MPTPELVLRRSTPECRLSVILIDWGVRESFHSLRYLNEQTAPRDQYELLWLEFYDRKPARLCDMVFRDGPDKPLVDQWLVAGYPDDVIFNKHRLYNLGLLLAQGRYCVVCDSDAIFTPNFVAKVLDAFMQTPRAVIHVDQVRNVDPRFHPFAYPAIEDILGPGCINWHGGVSSGLAENNPDMIHSANYGACMAAARTDLIAIGGADEHIDYLGYMCGPYDMTFRLVNHGLAERWLRDEYLYHVWHPNEGGPADYQGPNDGRGMALRALEARDSGRVEPALENPWIRQARQGKEPTATELVRLLAERAEPDWRYEAAPAADEVAVLVEQYRGFNLFRYRRHWYALRTEDGFFESDKRKGYRVLYDALHAHGVKRLVDHYHTLPRTFLGRLTAEPIYRLPWRALRRVGKEIGRLF
ncbi:MAG: glycosyltransferase [Gemmataceae bacterium]